jgi:precorrin-2 dehydrogenase / sirohydrochlorin ferrochelatase
VTTDYYPLILKIAKRLCIVVGGGNVAERKVKALLPAGGKIRIISPEITKSLSRLLRNGKIEHLAKKYTGGDLKGAFLVFAATNDRETNSQVAREAAKRKIMVNVADDPSKCDFVVPAVVRKPPLLLAISTSGILPGASKKIRQEIVEKISNDHRVYVRRLGAFRKFLLTTIADEGTRKVIMEAVLKEDMIVVAQMTLSEMKTRFARAPNTAVQKPSRQD